MKPIRLVIVDDALFVREALRRLLSPEPRVEIVGTAATGEELLAHLDEWRPDAVTLDLNMPGWGGLETLDHIMRTRPLPVIILSTHSGEGAPATVEALSRGAVDFIDKEAYSLVDFEALRLVLVEKLLHVTSSKGAAKPAEMANGAGDEVPLPIDTELIVIGASTGGPPAIETILKSLRPEQPAPVAIVQHMPPGFTLAFAERLGRVLACPVREAEDWMFLSPGTVTIGAAGQHLRVGRMQGRLVARLDPEPAAAIHRPSVDVLFESAASVAADRVCAVLLTGMGSDGARGMVRLHEVGAHTIAQDAASSIVYGMPRAAVERGVAREVLPLDAIGPRLATLNATTSTARKTKRPEESYESAGSHMR
jgi:two-component system chemotaxis response regulator CheB